MKIYALKGAVLKSSTHKNKSFDRHIVTFSWLTLLLFTFKEPPYLHVGTLHVHVSHTADVPVRIDL